MALCYLNLCPFSRLENPSTLMRQGQPLNIECNQCKMPIFPGPLASEVRGAVWALPSGAPAQNWEVMSQRLRAVETLCDSVANTEPAGRWYQWGELGSRSSVGRGLPKLFLWPDFDCHSVAQLLSQPLFSHSSYLPFSSSSLPFFLFSFVH